MLCLPHGLFAATQDYATELFPTYITKNLSTQDISTRVQQNLKTKKLFGDVEDAHLRYCQEHNLADGVELAEVICQNPENKEWEKRIALEYLLKIKGEEYIYEHFLPTQDTELLSMIANSLFQKRNPKLEQCLVEQNQNSENPLFYLSYLIKMSSEYGLRRYYELAKESNSTPDYGQDDNIGFITESIETIKSVNHLPRLVMLIHLRFAKDFRDRDIQGLYYSLHKALENIAIDNYEAVLYELQNIIKDESENQQLLAFCNNTIESIKEQHYNQKDTPWSIEEAVRFIKSN